MLDTTKLSPLIHRRDGTRLTRGELAGLAEMIEHAQESPSQMPEPSGTDSRPRLSWSLTWSGSL